MANKDDPGAVAQAKRYLPLAIVIAAIISSWARNEYRLSQHETLPIHPIADERVKKLELKDAALESTRAAVLTHMANGQIHQTEAEKQMLVRETVAPLETRLIRIEEAQKQVARSLEKIEDKLNIP